MRLIKRRTPELTVVAGAALALLLALPSTRWVLRRQFALQFSPLSSEVALVHSIAGRDPQEVAERVAQTAAARYPNDVAVQIAAAMRAPGDHVWLTPDEASSRMEDLRPRFSGSSVWYAAILRLNAPQLGWHESRWMPQASQSAPRQRYALPMDHRTIAGFIADARSGERYDPDNAFFPFIRAIALLGSPRDREGLAALDAAAARSVWRDYSAECAEGRLRLCNAMLSHPGALDELAALRRDGGADLSSVYASFGFAIAQLSRDAEAAGHVEAARRMRWSAMRCGAMMRAQSVHMSEKWAGAGMFLSMMPSAHSPAMRDEFARSAYPDAAAADEYCRQLERQGRVEEARWVRPEYAEAIRCVRLGDARPRAGQTTFVSLLGWLWYGWTAGTFCLANALWMLAIGLLCAMPSCSAFARERRPLAGPVRWGVGLALGALAVVAFSSLCHAIAFYTQPPAVPQMVLKWTQQDQAALVLARETAPTWLRISVAMLCALLSGGVALRQRGRVAGLISVTAVALAGALSPEPGVAAAAGYVAIALAVGGIPRRIAIRPLMWSLFTFVAMIASVLGCWLLASCMLNGALVDQHGTAFVFVYWRWIPASSEVPLVGLAALIVPLLTACVLGLVARARRVPATSLVMDGMRKMALPVACVLVMLQAGTIVSIAVLESSAHERIARSLAPARHPTKDILSVPMW